VNEVHPAKLTYFVSHSWYFEPIMPVICHLLFAIPNFSSKRIVLAASEVCRILACYLPLAIPNIFLLTAKQAYCACRIRSMPNEVEPAKLTYFEPLMIF